MLPSPKKFCIWIFIPIQLKQWKHGGKIAYKHTGTTCLYNKVAIQKLEHFTTNVDKQLWAENSNSSIALKNFVDMAAQTKDGTAYISMLLKLITWTVFKNYFCLK